jgi:tetratricopeptide (TPR) repeat protein
MLTNRGDCYRALSDFIKALEDYLKAYEAEKKNE